MGTSGRYTRLRLSMGRHPVDLTLIVVAAGVVIGCLVAARQPTVNPVEAAIFTQVEELPAWTVPGWRVVTWLGWWPGITAAVGIALYLARIRMAVALAGAGAVSWVLSLVVNWLVGPRQVSHALMHHATRLPAQGFPFPAVEVAVIAGLATAAGPYVGRAARQLLWVLVVLVAIADVFLGRNLPLGVFAGAVLGWGVGRLAHLVLGAPGRRASEQSVLVALRESGLDPMTVTTTGRSLLRPERFEVVTTDGQRLQMKLVRRLHRVAGPGHKLRRAVASLDVEHEPRLSTPRHEVEHEAYVTLLAERAGVGVAPVLLAGEIEHGPPFLIRRCVDGRPLSSLSPQDVDEALLDRIWKDITRLEDQHIAHHDLRAANILVDREGCPRITDFTFSRAGGPPDQAAQDVAEALVSLASVVGVDRSVASAVRCVPKEKLERALPYLQWLALHRRIKRQVMGGKVTLTYLRESLAERIAVPVPSFRSPVRPSTLAMMLAGGVAVYLLLPELSSMSDVLDSMKNANWAWLGAAVATGLIAIVASALTLLGSTPLHLPVGKTIAVQVAAAFTGRTTAAGVGFYGVNLVFLERLGFRRAHAVGVIVLNRVAMGVVSAVLTALGVLVIGNAVPIGGISFPTSPLVLAGIGVVVLVAVVVLASPFGRRRVWQPVIAAAHETLRDLLPVLRHPLRTAELFGGAVVFLLLSAFGLVATLEAFGVGFPALPVMAVFIVGSTLGQIAPTPGGLGAVEAALVAGLTAVGIPPAAAVASVLASRVLTFWLPVLPGIAAFRILQHHGVV